MEHGILGWVAIGLVAGVLATWILPRRDPFGLAVPVVIGIAGALLAGFVAQALGLRIGEGWHNAVAAAIGSVILLGLYRLILSRRGR